MASLPPSPPFMLARKVEGYHVAVHAADARLNPPKSYLLVQTSLVLCAGLLWTMAYLFYSIRAFRDHRSAMPLYSLYACLAWELVYWIVCASTTFERFGYGIWFVADLVHAAIVIRYQYADRKGQATREMCRGVGFFCVCFWTISIFNPDHESSAFFIGFVIQISVSYGSLYDIVWGEDMKGHSLEIWFVKPHASHSRGTQSLIRVTGALGL
ncbi:MAG: hypothetical protein ASARMPRED_003501 [Alectoria sarmentosa]|nr:MAG: hypothetical protein ASARMPRED_003501 [Alectoria sarmentosa]